jgi:hypothetical protein
MELSSDFKATNMVMVTNLSSSLSLPAVFELLTIMPVDFTFGAPTGKSKTTRSKIPFFGFDNILVSVRFDGKSRGIRNTGGQLRNIVSIDLQFASKNIHLKISEGKIVLMGALDKEMGDGAFATTLAHLEMVNDHWTHFMSLSPEKRQDSMKWLVELFSDPAGELRSHDCSVVKTGFSKIPFGVDSRSVLYLSMFAHEGKSISDFTEKLERIAAISIPIYKKKPLLSLSKIANSVYNYKLGERISLTQVATAMDKLGYGVSYHNWKAAKSFQAMIPVSDADVAADALIEFDDDLSPTGEGKSPRTVSRLEVDDDDLDDLSPVSPTDDSKSPRTISRLDEEKLLPVTVRIPSKGKKKVLAHRFTVYQGGSIRQWSPTNGSVAIGIRDKLIADIHKIIGTAR